MCSSSSTLASTSSTETSLLPLMMALEAEIFRTFSLLSISDIAFASLATLMAHFLHSFLRTWASSSSVETEMSSSWAAEVLYWYWMW